MTDPTPGPDDLEPDADKIPSRGGPDAGDTAGPGETTQDPATGGEGAAGAGGSGGFGT